MINFEVVEPQDQNPKRTVIIGSPKVGKTSTIGALRSDWTVFTIDLEASVSFYGGAFADVKKIANDQNISKLDAFKYVVKELWKLKKEKGKAPFDFIVLDSLTELEDLAKEYGKELYKATPMGSKWQGTDITSLPNGAGEGWLRQAFEKLYMSLDGLYEKGIIYTAHLKLGSLEISGMEIQTKDIQLRGQLKSLVCRNMDAIGFMRRNKKGDQVILSFKNSASDVVVGTRCPHLRNQEFVLSEMDEAGVIKTNWKQIYK